jgi:hypothetical protein
MVTFVDTPLCAPSARSQRLHPFGGIAWSLPKNRRTQMDVGPGLPLSA